MADVSYMIDDDSEYSVDAHFSSESEFEDDIENIPPPAPKSKNKAAVKPSKKTSKSSTATKKTKKIITLEDDDDGDDDDIDQRPPVPLAERSLNETNSKKDHVKGSNKSKTVEETYTKMSQLEHILKRPDTYSK
jgi:DNA topoisomerase-2